jgi:RNase P subunit RPR2
MKYPIVRLIALISVAVLANAVRAEETDKGDVQKQTQIKSQADFDALPAGTTVSMACSKCKSVTVMKKEQVWRGRAGGMKEVTRAETVHGCPGCGGKMTLKQGWVHTCSSCGDDSAFCCATTVPLKPTPGMEQKK